VIWELEVNGVAEEPGMNYFANLVTEEGEDTETISHTGSTEDRESQRPG
jgi:hypothetical protein